MLTWWGPVRLDTGDAQHLCIILLSLLMTQNARDFTLHSSYSHNVQHYIMSNAHLWSLDSMYDVPGLHMPTKQPTCIVITSTWCTQLNFDVPCQHVLHPPFCAFQTATSIHHTQCIHSLTAAVSLHTNPSHTAKVYVLWPLLLSMEQD